MSKRVEQIFGFLPNSQLTQGSSRRRRSANIFLLIKSSVHQSLWPCRCLPSTFLGGVLSASTGKCWFWFVWTSQKIFPVSCVVQVTLSSSDLCHRVASHRVAGECNWFAFKLLQVSQVQVTFSVCSVEHYHDESIKLIKQIKSNQIDYTVNLNKNDWIGNATTLCNAKPLCRGREKCKV